ncbi:UNVERIFIED_CONTAM: hypothetical protein FKN15_027627 [Acipenser sinensis]
MLLQWKEKDQRPDWAEVAPLSCRWQVPSTGEPRLQLMVPALLQSAVLQAIHGAPGVGHFGISMTLACLRVQYYWGHCRSDVETYCRQCDNCTAKKGPTERMHAPFSPSRKKGHGVRQPIPCDQALPVGRASTTDLEGHCSLASALAYRR